MLYACNAAEQLNATAAPSNPQKLTHMPVRRLDRLGVHSAYLLVRRTERAKTPHTMGPAN